ncbi:hypothetical protein AGMMS49941_10770 [Deferribacterales bacterium]|nr:hypothetical protein AGMMS49941_10770 [Deferribacterales bacterium]
MPARYKDVASAFVHVVVPARGKPAERKSDHFPKLNIDMSDFIFNRQELNER